MPDEPLTPDPSDQTDLSPDVPDPEHAAGGDTPDWEKRYKDAQAWGTQQSQRAAELEQYQQWYSALANPDTQAQALQILGLELEDKDTPDASQNQFDEEDELAQLRQEQERIKAQLAQRDEDQQLRLLEGEINSNVKAMATEAGLNVKPALQRLLFNDVIATPPKADGSPNYEDAVQTITELRDEWIKSYRETKRRAPSAPIPGTPGNPDHKFGDVNARLKLANLIAQEAEAEHA